MVIDMSQTEPLQELLERRWSPRDYDPRPIPAEAVQSLFEAARASFSCFNEQPWRFVVATKDQPEDYARILDTLVPKNQEWARNAYLLGITVGKKTFRHNEAANRYGLHDAGAALAFLSVQAVAQGLQVHGMGGFDHAKARVDLGIPEDFELGAAFAVGYVAEGVAMPARQRLPLGDLVFRPGWVAAG